MNSSERREKRYQRRREKRREKRYQKSKELGDFKDVFSYENLYKSALVCFKGVRWKASTQNFACKLPTNIQKIYKSLHAGTYKSKGFQRFSITERGKKRNIQSVHISERVVQKALCDGVLVPLHASAYIFDNGASQKGKGMDFSLNRLKIHLRRHFRRHLCAGYVLLFDFSNYFGTAPHDIIYRENERRLHDPKIRKIANLFMENFGDVGLGLGSQVSQTYALTCLSGFDHFIKERLRIKGYGRYMDDGYLIHHDREYLKFCLAEIKMYAEERKFILNESKTRIVPICKGFKFLKTKFTLSENGKIYLKMSPGSTKRMQAKLRTFSKWVKCGKISLSDANQAFMSYKGHMKRGNSYKKLKIMTKYFDNLFGGNYYGLECSAAKSDG